MKKALCMIVAVMLALCMFACSNWTSTITDYAGEVSSNGGFAVVKGDYVYFINGIEESTATNTFGTPVKGSLVRVKTSTLGEENPACEQVVPKLIYTATQTENSGFYIFGDYVYYTSPCDQKDKSGNIMNTKLQYCKTSIDGKKTQIIVTLENNNDVYRFVEIGEKVYLAVYVTVTDEDDEDTTYNYIYIYDTTKSYDSTSNKPYMTEEITGYLFSSDNSYPYAYYEKKGYDDKLEQDEKFSEVYRIKLDGSEDKMILSGESVGTQGATFSLINDNGSYLYLSETYVDTSTTSVTRYYSIKNDNFGDDVATNYGKLSLINNNTSEASTIFAGSTYYINQDKILYFDTTYGFILYDSTKKDDATFGRTKIYYDEDMISYTLSFYDNGYAYFYDDDSNYYRLNIADYVDLTSGAQLAGSAELTRVTYCATTNDSSWYRAEVIGNYIISAVTTTPYNSYVYAFDMTVMDGKTDDEIADYIESLDTSEEENILNFNKHRIGILSEADEETLEEYLESTFDDED